MESKWQMFELQRGSSQRVVNINVCARKPLQTKENKHNEILDIGQPLWQHHLDEMEKKFMHDLNERESFLKKEITKKHHDRIVNMKREHTKCYENIRIKSSKALNKLFFHKLHLIEHIKNKNADLGFYNVVVAEDKLDKAILNSRCSFNEEKKREVQIAILEQQRQYEIRINEITNKQEDTLDELTSSWKLNIKLEITSFNEQYTKTCNEILSKKSQCYKADFETKIREAKNNGVNQINSIENSISNQEKKNEYLKKEREKIIKDGNLLINKMPVILAAYQDFLDSDPQFNQGQCEFLLQSMVPDSFYKELKVAEKTDNVKSDDETRDESHEETISCEPNEGV